MEAGREVRANRPKICKKLLYPTTTATLKQVSTMTKYTEPTILYEYCWPEEPATICY